MYNIMNVTTDSLLIFLYLQHTLNNAIVITSENSMSIRVTILTVSVQNSDEVPNTNKILNKLEPITFPTAMSNLPFFVAITDVTHSAKLVPNATTVNPIKLSHIPNALAISVAPLTTKVPPYIILYIHRLYI